MPRDVNEELERLEAELLRADATKKLPVVEAMEETKINMPPLEDYEEEDFEEDYEEDDYEEEDYEEEDEQQNDLPEFNAYTNQSCDVDLAEFSEEVEKEPKNKGLGFLTVLFVVLTSLLCLCIWAFLKFGGFLG